MSYYDYSLAELIANSIDEKIREIIEKKLEAGDIAVLALQKEVEMARAESQRRNDVSDLLTKSTKEVIELRETLERRDARIKFLLQFKPKKTKEPDWDGKERLEAIKDNIQKVIKGIEI